MFPRLSADCVSVFLQRVAMACVTDTSEEHIACIFKVEVSNVFPYSLRGNVGSIVHSEPLYG
jgi:hypothetical protein